MLSRRATLALLDELEWGASGLHLRFVPPNDLSPHHINRRAGLKATITDALPEHEQNRSWNWLPFSARTSGTGLVFVYGGEGSNAVSMMGIAPPFPIEALSIGPSFDPLRDIVRTGCEVLIADLHSDKARLAVAIDERVDMARSRTVRRYVRGRHRAGGQSANRFKRNRDGWQRKFNEKLADAVHDLARASKPPIEWLAVAGDHQWVSQTNILSRTGLKLLPRTFDCHSDDRSALSRIAREVWSSRVFERPETAIS